MKTEHRRKLCVISLDAVGTKDFEYLCGLEHTGRIVRESIFTKHVESIYPSITYPAHTTIVTGRYPRSHGIVDNTFWQPQRFRSPDWYWYRKYIKGTTLYDEVLKQGRTVAAIMWPVTASSRITYNFPEIFANRKWKSQLAVSLRHGSPLYELKMFLRYKDIVNGSSQPELDEFSTRVALDTVREYQPDLLLLHYTDVDTMKHDYGNESEQRTQALERMDAHIGQLYDCLQETYGEDGFDLVLLGDHSQKDVSERIDVNRFLLEKGWLTVAGEQIIDWKAYGKGCDGACYIYIKKLDKDRQERLFADLSQWARETVGIRAVLGAKSIAARGGDKAAFAMLEAHIGFWFSDWMVENPGHVACHGFMPDIEDYHTFFCFHRKGLETREVGEMKLVDVGATLGELAGVDLGEIDGESRTEFCVAAQREQPNECPVQEGAC
ncbi:MAG: ectonucleotide pyrophosphatase/phosphodiesterase [Lachnospiraceae bacterium]|nr:ectonucleotide pyrophosphatase/phosphodiesterase [Lachnospiraceae bacterium]MDY5741720.1 ectonucleotide pyrophosphatase/phosphodiesterase [Lachnospiraceae bacterium]